MNITNSQPITGCVKRGTKAFMLLFFLHFWTISANHASGSDSGHEGTDFPVYFSWEPEYLARYGRFATPEPGGRLYEMVTETRHHKSPFRIAFDRNMVLYTQIEEMLAHTVADALRRETGLFVISNQDFGALSLTDIQGSEDFHVTYMIDGIPINMTAYGTAETVWIPVGIIQKIEVIKGAASSTWGTALGGVINIVTKTPGEEGASNAVTSFFGERGTQDHRAQLTGKTGNLGYFIHAGRMDSGTLRNEREFERNDVFAKASFEAPGGFEMMMTLLYSEPVLALGEYRVLDLEYFGAYRSFLSKFDLIADLTDKSELSLSVYGLDQKYAAMMDTLGLNGPAGELYSDFEREEQTKGIRGKFVWKPGFHVIVLGFDFDKTKFDLEIDSGSELQNQGAPLTFSAKDGMTKRALYVNDTYTLGNWTFTFGIRFDDNDTGNSQLNPSLGLTYMPHQYTIFRLCVSRGFTTPPLIWKSTGELFIRPNPDLEAEEVWSYQAGFDTIFVKYLWLKGVVYYHDMNNAFRLERYGDVNGDFYNMNINMGKTRRRGFDFDIETVRFHGLSFSSGFSYSLAKYYEESDNDERLTWNVGMKYASGESFHIDIYGRYERWNLDEVYESNLNDMIFDVTVRKKLFFMEYPDAELFVNMHNLFNGSQYTVGDDKNPERWLEAGIRVDLPSR